MSDSPPQSSSPYLRCKLRRYQMSAASSLPSLRWRAALKLITVRASSMADQPIWPNRVPSAEPSPPLGCGFAIVGGYEVRAARFLPAPCVPHRERGAAERSRELPARSQGRTWWDECRNVRHVPHAATKSQGCRSQNSSHAPRRSDQLPRFLGSTYDRL